MFLIWLCSLAALLSGTYQEPVKAHIALPPAVVKTGGQLHLVYELHLTNQLQSAIRLHAVDVLHKPSARTLAHQSPRAPLRPGERQVVYFWIPLDEIPDTIEHRITVVAAGDTLQHLAGIVPVTAAVQQPVLGAPLRGGPWVAVYDPALERGHRRVLFEAESAAPRIPARFAIDWMRVNERGELASGDGDVVANHFGYGADVLAVADARVVSVRNGVIERSRRVPIAHGPALASGNYITLDLGNGHFVSYEHLKTGSVLVEPGDSVRRGQVIARVGFSGDGSHPHLHMHVSDGATPMSGEGLPWALAEYGLLGRYASLNAVFARRPWQAHEGERTRRNELPAPNVVVLFPD